MGRRENKMKKPRSSSFSSSTRHAVTPPVVYVSLGDGTDFGSWAMIDPNLKHGKQQEEDVILFQSVPDMEKKVPQDLCNLHNYSLANYDSKIFFIGGQLYLKENGKRIISDKVFVYDLVNKSWHEFPSRLNIARASSHVFVVGKVIYVISGLGAHIEYPSHNTYIEYYDFDYSVNVNKKWEILDAPIPLLVASRCISAISSALYERGNQMLFFVSRVGVFSFNYVEKSWKRLKHMTRLDGGGFDSYCFPQVAIVDDILFCAIFPTITAYHLKKKAILLRYSLWEEENPNLCHHFADLLLLYRTGKDTLLLVSLHSHLVAHNPPPERELYCCKYRIRYTSGGGIILVQEGSQVFEAQCLGTCILVQPPPPPHSMDSLICTPDSVKAAKAEGTVAANRNTYTVSKVDLDTNEVAEKDDNVSPEVANVERPVNLYKAFLSDDSDNEEEETTFSQVKEDSPKKVEAANTTLNHSVSAAAVENILSSISTAAGTPRADIATVVRRRIMQNPGKRDGNGRISRSGFVSQI